MSNTALGATPNHGWQEKWSEATRRSGQTRGFHARRPELSEKAFAGTYVFRFGPTNCSLSSFDAFHTARRGAYDSFLWKARTYVFSHIDDEAVGTGDAATTSFTLDYKHIDSTTLTVSIDGDAKGSGWSLSANDTAPAIVFTVAPSAASAVTADYEFYIPVTMPDDLVVRPKTNDLTATQILETPPMVFRQDKPGSHKA